MAQKTTKETRKVGVSFVTLGPPELRRIATLVDEEAQKESSAPEFTLTCSDGSKFETGDTATFEDANMPIGQVESIDMYWDVRRPNDKRIHISIKQESDFMLSSYSYIEVKGADSTWVNGVTAKLQNILAEYKHSHGILYRLWPIRMAVVYLLCSGAIFLLVWSLSEPRSDEWLGISLPVAMGVGYMLAMGLDSLLRSAFPNVEIQNTRGSRAAKRRGLLYFVVGFILIPILVGIISGLISD